MKLLIILFLKTQRDVKSVLSRGDLRGGYSPLKSFINIWKCKLIDEKEKDGLGFS